MSSSILAAMRDSIKAYIQFCWHTLKMEYVREKTEQSQWYKVMSITARLMRAAHFFTGFLTSLGLGYVFVVYVYPLLSKRAWAIIFLSLFASFLLFLIAVIKRYHERTLDELNTKYAWLYEIEREEAESIERSVKAEEIDVIPKLLQVDPSVEFRFFLRNMSVFEVSIDEAIAGYIEFGDHKLMGQMTVRQLATGNPPYNVRHLHQMSFSLELSLSPQEAEKISSSHRNAYFNFHELIIPIKGGDRFSQVERRPLAIRHTVHITGWPLRRIEE